MLIQMNIYKVSRITEADYDQYDEFICIAEDETQAKNLNQNFPTIDNPRNFVNIHLN